MGNFSFPYLTDRSFFAKDEHFSVLRPFDFTRPSEGIIFYPFLGEPFCPRNYGMSNKLLLIVGIFSAVMTTFLFWYGHVIGAVLSLSIGSLMLGAEVVQRYLDAKVLEKNYYTWPIVIEKNKLHRMIYATAFAGFFGGLYLWVRKK